MKRLLATLLFVSSCAPHCPTYVGPGKKAPVTIQADVRIALDTCTEDRAMVSGNGEYATLACSDGGTGPIFRILFPRKQWQGMKQDGIGTINQGPGK